MISLRRALLLSTGMYLTGACTASADRVTAPASPEAAAIDGLWTFALWTGVAVWTGVMVLAAIPVWRSRRHRGVDDTGHADGRTGHGGRHDADRLSRSPGAVIDEPVPTAAVDARDAADADHRARSRLLWIGGIIGPVVILSVLLVASGRVGAMTAHTEHPDEIVVDVTGHMFWWEVQYPDHDVTTANEIHVPVDRPVRVRLTSEDVIHSFWIPRLHGKIDTIPGQENWLSFEATQTGRYRGACAEYCGLAHAQMAAIVEVRTQEDFDAWVERQRDDAPSPEEDTAAQGARVFLDAGCAGCHTIRGTEAAGGLAPDLTHLADRATLASGTAPNDRAHLAELIVDPRAMKPGIRMPPSVLPRDDLDALLTYLETLGSGR